MHAISDLTTRTRPSAKTGRTVTSLEFDDLAHDVERVAVPRPEIRVVVRFGPAAEDRLDVHALGVRQRAYRKRVHGVHRIIMARLHLGAAESVLGVPASAVAGRIVALRDLWGDAASTHLREQLASASNAASAATVLESAISARVAIAPARHAHAELALDAADRLTRGNVNVNEVARDLRVSERHLRRVFHETVGIAPKAFVKLTRFHRALRAARQPGETSWASIAVAAGYYDQAHLIADFHSIAGVTPRALLAELRAEGAFA